VYGLDSVSDSKINPVEAANLLNTAFVNSLVAEIDPHFVVHLAAVSFVGHGEIRELYESNIFGTRNLLEALRFHGKSLKKVIIASSANVYGNSDVEFIDEDCPVRPTNDYAVSKVAVENIAKIYSHDIPVVVTRPFNYTGIGQSQKFLVPKLVEHFVQKFDEISLGNLDVARDFSDVRTVVWAYGRLLNAGVPGEIYNIASGESRTLASIIEDLQILSSHEIHVKSNEKLLRTGEVLNLRGDASKLWDTVGSPTEITFNSTLRWMLGATKDVRS
jgi:nucleoside-diphosphate-sugar epimerase